MADRSCYLSMIRAMPGGWPAMSAALGFPSVSALENRIYERSGQTVSVHQAEQMQALSGTTAFAEEQARLAGGTFMKLPEVEQLDNDELLDKFNELYAHLGELSTEFREYSRDDEIDAKERKKLDRKSREIHQALSELMAVMFAVYCPDSGADADD